ncbi:hypothetical protein C5167_000548 [Papaver somniferum]|uniref:Uncharacterized protein n=1 Tax=Papaver somniferum TaxID=3469 RepID=A0A4Y7KSR4_PAPSO|nr:hypothetical protein C5167_000548 [Papaver somniferum]
MEELPVETKGIPAPAPTEQRWSAQSKSLMSPASSLVEDDIFSWVGAHGTGARLPPIDEQVISMKLVIPAKGTIERRNLRTLEDTFVFNMIEIKKNHKKWLTETVVVVTCNPVSKWRGPPKFEPKYVKDEALQYVRDLHLELGKKYRIGETAAKSSENDEPDIKELSFTELTDKLLSLDPLDERQSSGESQRDTEWDGVMKFWVLIVVVSSRSQRTSSLLEA